MKIYKNTLTSTALTSFIPTAPSANKLTAAIVICNNLVSVFGIPTISGETVRLIINANIWDDVGQNVSIMLAEAISGTGVLGSYILGGLPVFLVSGAVNVPLLYQQPRDFCSCSLATSS